MKASILALIGTILFASPVRAEQEVTVFGAGASVTCGKWLAEKNEDNLIGAVYRQWLLGFVTGAAAAGIKMGDTDSAAMFAWMDKYCRENPLDTAAVAAAKLVIALQGKAAKPK